MRRDAGEVGRLPLERVVTPDAAAPRRPASPTAGSARPHPDQVRCARAAAFTTAKTQRNTRLEKVVIRSGEPVASTATAPTAIRTVKATGTPPRLHLVRPGGS